MKQPYMVTTEHRGVFMGWMEPIESFPAEVRLENARMCVYWPAENHGVGGLVKDGPKKGARVGPAAPSVLLNGITGIWDISTEALERWEAEPWS